MEYRENEIHAKIRQYKFWIEQNTIQMRHREKSCKPVVSNLFLATGRISPYWTCRGPQRWSAGGEGGCKSKFSAADGWPPSSITLALRTPTLVFGLTFFRRDDHVRGGGVQIHFRTGAWPSHRRGCRTAQIRGPHCNANFRTLRGSHLARRPHFWHHCSKLYWQC